MKKPEPKMTNHQAREDRKEIVSLMAYFKAMHPNVQAHELLKFAGFNIAGLEATKSLKSTGLGRGDHRLAWHKVYGGVCTCCQWQADQKWRDDEGKWVNSKITAQHQIHARKEKMAHV